MDSAVTAKTKTFVSIFLWLIAREKLRFSCITLLMETIVSKKKCFFDNIANVLRKYVVPEYSSYVASLKHHLAYLSITTNTSTLTRDHYRGCLSDQPMTRKLVTFTTYIEITYFRFKYFGSVIALLILMLLSHLHQSLLHKHSGNSFHQSWLVHIHSHIFHCGLYVSA